MANKQPRNHPGLERAIVGLYLAQDALDELIEHLDENESCPCRGDGEDNGYRAGVLDDARGIRFNVGVGTSFLEGVALTFQDIKLSAIQALKDMDFLKDTERLESMNYPEPDDAADDAKAPAPTVVVPAKPVHKSHWQYQ